MNIICITVGNGATTGYSNTRGFKKSCVESTGTCFYNIDYDWPETDEKAPENLLKKCQEYGLDRPLPINDKENEAMQALCLNSMIGIVSCHGDGPLDWCDVKTPTGARVKYLNWRDGEGSSPKKVASGHRHMGTQWWDASPGDANAAQTTCCEYRSQNGKSFVYFAT